MKQITQRQKKRIQELMLKPYNDWLKTIDKNKKYFPGKNCVDLNTIKTTANIVLANTQKMDHDLLVEYKEKQIKLINDVVSICENYTKKNNIGLIPVFYFRKCIDTVKEGLMTYSK